MSTALTIPDIDPKTEDALRRRAEAGNTSMAAAARSVLQQALRSDGDGHARKVTIANGLPADLLEALESEIEKLPEPDRDEYPVVRF